ncbi:MAG TPA: M48 family metallopeptidase [Thermoanaerobaculia bacterium]|nr:M48 family metallopeptidase [Thermoanaerobaculia bacterium]
MRMLLRFGLALAAVAVATVVVVSLSAQQAGAGEREKTEAKEKRFEVQVTDEMRRHTRIGDTLYFVGTAWSFGVLALLLVTGLSRRMRDAAARATKRPFLLAMLYIALLTLAVAVLEFPLSYYAGFVVPHQFELTEQSFGSWMGDMLKGLAVSIAIGSVIGALALLAIRRFRRWWVVLWMATVPLIILMVVVQPILLDPIFNKFEPLQDEVLRRKLVDLASHAGIEGGRVYQVNKSKQTKTMNAYVNGIGPTNRIVMWDTLLAKMDHDEVLGVMGHEMGHYVLEHIWKTLAFLLVLSVVVFYFTYRSYEPGLRRWGSRWGVAERGDPASLPWLLLVASAISFLFSPVISGYSRMHEHDADVFALELTRLNEPFATAFVKMAEDSKRDPSPHPFIKFWRYTHPPIAERIPFALQYKPWERGEPNQMWKGE